jgi:hypothetical protein
MVMAGATPQQKKKAEDKKAAGTPSAQAQAAAANIPAGTTTGSKDTLLNLPKGTQISTGSGWPGIPYKPDYKGSAYTQASFTEGDAEKIFASKTPEQRAALLVRLGQIPGLYSKGKEPTLSGVQSMGNQVVWRSEDTAALKKILPVTDQLGDASPDVTIDKLLKSPALATTIFGGGAGTAKAVTPRAQLEAEMNAKFMDLFESPADKAAVSAYAKEVNKLESSAAGISAQQKEDIFLKYTQKKANDLYNLSQTGMAPGVTEKGALGTYVRNIRGAYADNGLPINEKDVYTQAVSALRSKDAYNNIISGIQQHAATIMPAFKDLIAQGKTAKEILSPYINLRAQILEVPADQIKVSDMYDVASGDKPVSIQDYKTKLYGSEDFKKTNAFKERSLGDMKALLKAFRIG